MKDDLAQELDERLHPRHRAVLIGHGGTERRLLDAYRSGKLHHGWILNGPRGIGKATLAYRFTRFLLRYPDPAMVPAGVREGCDVDPADPVFRRVAAQGHADLITITRAYDTRNKRLKAEIGVDEARQASQFLGRTAGEGGWRVVIVDAADEMTASAANALLKSLEEPPPRTVFLLVSHVSGRLLPTIRSRCIRLDLAPLADEEVERVLDVVLEEGGKPSAEQRQLAIALAEGSPGRALQLLQGGGLKLFRDFSALLEQVPGLDYGRLFEFAERLRGAQALDDYRLFTELMEQWLSRRIRDAARGVDDWAGRMPLNRLGQWSEVHQAIVHSIGRANALNLDRREVIVQAMRLIDATARP
ncbi:DNA polymerase III subunit delta' [Rhodoligotrophos defluvii]|uniref:DNA polymerase III subunit delta' n=1 Tax=Rhodoligotrophos defluvii TaxID=2561934 RepID=UPI0010C98195|nr:DNA polymerase III subunit delta' [Rhodoligotrophos defluvii]